MTVDPRLVGAMRRQLVLLHNALAAGDTQIGWKLGVGDAERIPGRSPSAIWSPAGGWIPAICSTRGGSRSDSRGTAGVADARGRRGRVSTDLSVRCDGFCGMDI